MSSISVDDLKGNGKICRDSTANSYTSLSMDSSFVIDDAKKRANLIEWLNSLFPQLRLAADASEEDLRGSLIDGTVFYSFLNLMTHGSSNESQVPRLEKVQRFVCAMKDMGLPVFEVSELQWGSMKPIVDCLLALKDQLNPESRGVELSAKYGSLLRKQWKLLGTANSEGRNGTQSDPSARAPLSCQTAEERQGMSTETRVQRDVRTPVMPDISAASVHRDRQKFHEVFQMKQGHYSDLSPAKILEMLKTTSLDSAPTQSLLSVVNGILDESKDKKNGEIPHRVACLLRKVVQEIEHRLSAQAEYIKNQSNFVKAREEKYLSRIKVLESLANGSNEEIQISANQLQQIKTEKTKLEEAKKIGEQDASRLAREKETSDYEIKELKKKLEATKQTYEEHCLRLGTQHTETKVKLEDKLKEAEYLLEESRREIQQLKALSESEVQSWGKKESTYQNFMNVHSLALRGLRISSGSIKREILDVRNSWIQEFNGFGIKLKGLAEAAQNYHVVLAENRKLYNEVQDLKGNIRVYCRVRPFLSGQKAKESSIEFIGEEGELIISNPCKQGKEGHRMFKFDKVFGPKISQAEVFLDTQPLIRSVLDGYNVCIFAYGQTGSGKTYTMSGPEGATPELWGVNYRALSDLFQISRDRRSTILYEVGVQMVEIYNEQVRDLLSHGGSQKRLGILSASQPNGLAVPDASMHPVKSTEDVLALMQVGHSNRAVGATAMNVRSSRSHSVLTVHVRGTDLKGGAVLRGSLHLVDLAGSERVDRSEATGDRLKEAQHINKSLSALGDVIFALAQKSAHVPYRNSKLTQVLQSSLGGQAKTLMFVQLNPDADSYSETLSTLKFAERVSGVELGAARSSKEGKDVRELMEQVASLKDIIAKKDEEIERLQLLKDLSSVSPTVRSETYHTGALRHSSSQISLSIDARPHNISQSLSRGTASRHAEKGASEVDNCSEGSDRQSEAGSQHSMEDIRQEREVLGQTGLSLAEKGDNLTADVELLGFGDADYDERLSDISDGGLSVGTENEGSISSEVSAEDVKQVERINKPKVAHKLSRPSQKSGHAVTGHVTARESLRISSLRVSSMKEPGTGIRKTTEQSSPRTTKR